ncbi:hypothetical protein IMZ48_16155 [Candidatus Bathyarchaeota archaeon]|nr:hypothetical protein [Candidatus Bathyarchaeota archaeon]
MNPRKFLSLRDKNGLAARRDKGKGPAQLSPPKACLTPAHHLLFQCGD